MELLELTQIFAFINNFLSRIKHLNYQIKSKLTGCIWNQSKGTHLIGKRIEIFFRWRVIWEKKTVTEVISWSTPKLNCDIPRKLEKLNNINSLEWNSNKKNPQRILRKLQTMQYVNRTYCKNMPKEFRNLSKISSWMLEINLLVNYYEKTLVYWNLWEYQRKDWCKEWNLCSPFQLDCFQIKKNEDIQKTIQEVIENNTEAKWWENKFEELEYHIDANN